MAIPTSRTKETATITISHERCNGCGHCVSVCSDNSLRLENKKAVVNDNPYFGCIGCGHCMAVCPENAIEILGRTLQPDDMFELPSKAESADYQSLLSLLQRRRSMRKFLHKPVDVSITEKILAAAKTAPMGLPPSDVHVLVLDSKEKTHAFAKDFCQYLESMQWFVSKWFLAIMRPFWGKANDEMFKGFIRPMFKTFTQGMKEGKNLVTYDAPLTMYFYGSPYTDPADPIVAATYAMVAAESLGLGTCMLGSMHPMIQNGRKAKIFRERHSIRFKSREGLFVIFGYPAFSFHKGIKRSFVEVTFAE
ncbi:MAG: nitroreductase family protein [Bacteroidales bacterium]|nr:nitroreductase family protein [Bacteroidales bacterium]